jgi:hypothetical protein
MLDDCTQNTPIDIGTPAERAWQRLRVAILRNLDEPDDALRPVIERLHDEFLAACGE